MHETANRMRLVTDRFRETPLEVHEIDVKKDVEWREPFVSHTASEIFNNYDMTARRLGKRTPKVISDKMLHARFIGVLSGSAYLPDGLLIASDTQSKTQLFHFSPPEIARIFDAFLEDEVRRTSDGYMDKDGQVSGRAKCSRSGNSWHLGKDFWWRSTNISRSSALSQDRQGVERRGP